MAKSIKQVSPYGWIQDWVYTYVARKDYRVLGLAKNSAAGVLLRQDPTGLLLAEDLQDHVGHLVLTERNYMETLSSVIEDL